MRQVSGLHRDWLIGLPFLAEEPGLGWVAITEADIDNYAGMYLKKAPGAFAFAQRAVAARGRREHRGGYAGAGKLAVARAFDCGRAREAD